MNTLFVILIASMLCLAGVLAWLFARVRKIEQLNKVFLKGKDGKSLEGAILDNAEKLKVLDGDIQELFDISNKINNLAQKSLHRVGMVRFNPFKEIGGDQSFSVAILDGKNSGFTLSSLHAREGTRVYVKPIVRGESKKHTLTEEEKKAISLASRKNLDEVGSKEKQ